MELFRALGSLIEPPTPEHKGVAAALGLPPVPEPAVHGSEISFQRYPYASVYLGPEGMMGGEARARIAGFWVALGLEAPEEPDHLSALFSLLASLDENLAGERDEAQRVLLNQAKATLVWEHLFSWCVPYLTAFRGCAEPFYREWAGLCEGALRDVVQELEIPEYLPRALVEMPGFEDPRVGDDGEAFLRGLLAPSRSGLVILREDLFRASEELGLALRAGERRYVLSAFFAQDPSRTLMWARDFADAWCRQLSQWEGIGPIAQWWVDRGQKTARILRSLASDPSLGPVAAS